ncbi:DMT family transporter [Acetobacteraceae bacterium H6797]|nr:DMT family transporter [Acetobacteraceae bacterium H6797]
MKGIAIVAFGYAIITIADASVKWVLPEVGVSAAIVWRGLVGAIALAIVLRGRSLVPRRPWLVIARSLLHCLCTGIWFFVWMKGMRLADSYAIGAGVPLMVTLLAIPLLKEQVGWRRWTSTAVGFAGVLFMLQPGGDLWNWYALLMLFGVCALALSRVLTRILAMTDKPSTITFWLMLMHVPVGLALMPVMPAGNFFPGIGTVLILIGLGVVTGLAHVSFARAFGLAPASVLAPFEYSTLIWGLIIGLVIWGEVPAWTTLAGATVVVGAGLYNLHRERVRRAEARAGGKP